MSDVTRIAKLTFLVDTNFDALVTIVEQLIDPDRYTWDMGHGTTMSENQRKRWEKTSREVAEAALNQAIDNVVHELGNVIGAGVTRGQVVGDMRLMLELIVREFTEPAWR